MSRIAMSVKWGLIAGVFVLATGAEACAEPARKTSGPVGSWEIEAQEAGESTWTGTMILMAGDNGTITGHIDWSSAGGQSDGASGRELVRASYNQKNRMLTVTGEKLEKARGLMLGKYTARLSEDGSQLTEGKWSTDGSEGDWEASRVSADKPQPKDTSDDRGDLIRHPKTGFVRKKYALPDGTKADYWLFVPHNDVITKEVPVIVFLHGAGEAKGAGGALPIDVVLGPYIRGHEKTFSYIVIFPQAQEDGWKPKGINGQMITGILDRTLKEYKTDAEHVCLTGLSMGGIGTWSNAVAAPDRWAVIVPICVSANPERAERIKDIPCWAFHGSADQTIPVSGTRDMIAALKQAGGTPKYTEYPKGKHNCWDMAYATPELWKWLGAQRWK